MTTICRATVTILLLSLAACARTTGVDPSAQMAPPPQEGTTSASPVGERLAWARRVNAEGRSQLPTKHRPGHATVREGGKKPTVCKNAMGFSIDFGAGSPIPTPTVADSKIFVGGGFSTKEFHCCDARSGESIWSIDLDDDGPSTAAYADGVVVFNTESCTIFAVDALTGALKWSWYLGDPQMSMPAIANGRVYTSYPAQFSATASISGGAKLSQTPLIVGTPNDGPSNQGTPLSVPLAQNGNAPGVIAAQTESSTQADSTAQTASTPPAGPSAVPTHVLACFDLQTGVLIWQRWIDSDVMSAPVAVGDKLYVTSFGGTVYTFAQVNGKILDARAERATSAPLVTAQGLYLTHRSDTGSSQVGESIICLAPGSSLIMYDVHEKVAPYLDPRVQMGTALWSMSQELDFGNGFAGGAPPAANVYAANTNIGQGSVYSLQGFQGSRLLSFASRNFTCMGDEVLCIDPATGDKLWTYKLEGDLVKSGGFLSAPPAGAGDSVFVTQLTGEILQIDATSGKVKKRHSVGAPLRYQPAIVGGRIYSTTQNGKLVCIDTGDPSYDGWSTWGKDSRRTGVAK